MAVGPTGWLRRARRRVRHGATAPRAEALPTRRVGRAASAGAGCELFSVKVRDPALGLVAALSVFVVLIAPFVGSAGWDGADDESRAAARFILTELRIPRVLLAAAAGGALALAGVAFQALFRNPLATPYTLGVASGASFGRCWRSSAV